MAERGKISGAIFDLDGTLLDSMPVWRTLGSRYLQRKGIGAPETLGEQLAPMDMQQAAEYLKDTFGLSDHTQDMIACFHQMLREDYEYYIQPKPATVSYLQALSDAGVVCCVATASDQGLASAALKRLQLDRYFIFITSCQEVGFHKDSPELFDRVCARLGTPKEETIVVEDAPYAVRTASQAGYRVVLVYDETAKAQQRTLKKIVQHYIP